MPWNRLLSLLFPLALLFVVGPAWAGGPGQRRIEPEVILLRGEIELDRVKALEALERKVETFIEERYRKTWLEASGPLVPKPILWRELKEKIQRRWTRLPILGKRKIESYETTAGRAFQGEYDLLLGGAEERLFLDWSKAAASGIGDAARMRLLAGVLISLLILFLAGRLDRITRGYLTKRLFFLGFLLIGLVFWGYTFQGWGGLL